ncbi:hypothetical protein [Rhodococcoides fascians]|nr:hypothetical protein [Rhodococcus fascians]
MIRTIAEQRHTRHIGTGDGLGDLLAHTLEYDVYIALRAQEFSKVIQ